MSTNNELGNNKSVTELRKFGYVMALVLVLLGGLLVWRGRPLGPYMLFLGAAFGVCGVLFPKLLAPVEYWWLKFGEKMSVVMTFLVLSLLFFFVFAPFGFVLRLLGKDLLQLKLSKKQESYWVPVEVDGPSTRHFLPY